MVKALLLIALTAYAAPALAAPATQPSPAAVEKAKALSAHLDTFRLDLIYRGNADKPFYWLTLSVTPADELRSSPFHLHVQIDQAQARKIIDHLQTDGTLDDAVDFAQGDKPPVAPEPHYTLLLFSGTQPEKHEYIRSLGWNKPLLVRLDALKSILSGEAAKQMQTLLDRLSGLRREWEAGR